MYTKTCCALIHRLAETLWLQYSRWRPTLRGLQACPAHNGTCRALRGRGRRADHQCRTRPALEEPHHAQEPVIPVPPGSLLSRSFKEHNWMLREGRNAIKSSLFLLVSAVGKSLKRFCMLKMCFLRSYFLAVRRHEARAVLLVEDFHEGSHYSYCVKTNTARRNLGTRLDSTLTYYCINWQAVRDSALAYTFV